jgi:hypothetical protein
MPRFHLQTRTGSAETCQEVDTQSAAQEHGIPLNEHIGEYHTSYISQQGHWQHTLPSVRSPKNISSGL